jgi:hypothetical protein
MWRTGEMLWHELRGGMALRRGDLGAAARPLAELRSERSRVESPSGSSRWRPVVLPHALVTNDRVTLVEVVDRVLSLTDRAWGQLPVTAIPRAVAAAGETELLERVSDLFTAQRASADAPRIAIAATAGVRSRRARCGPRQPRQWSCSVSRPSGNGGWAGPTAQRASTSTSHERSPQPGPERDASAARERATAVLAPLRCVHAY